MHPISQAIRGSGGIELRYVFTKETKVITLRGLAQLADLQGALCVSPYNFTCGVDGKRVLLLACPVTHNTLPLFKAHGLLSRPRTILTA